MKHASLALGFLCGALLFLGGCSDSQDIDGPLLAFPEGEGFVYPMEIGTNPMALTYHEPNWDIVKDGISIGYACRYTFEVPFSEEFLDDPTTAGVGYLNSMFVVVMDSWTYDLNDGWVCYPGLCLLRGGPGHSGSPGGTITVDSKNKKGDLVRNQVHPTYISVPY